MAACATVYGQLRSQAANELRERANKLGGKLLAIPKDDGTPLPHRLLDALIFKGVAAELREEAKRQNAANKKRLILV